jgi:hypothetical protein
MAIRRSVSRALPVHVPQFEIVNLLSFTATGVHRQKYDSLALAEAPCLPASRLDEANEFLRQGLADRPRPANEVKAEAKDTGVSVDALLTARANGAGSPRRAGAGGPGSGRWRLRADRTTPHIP